MTPSYRRLQPATATPQLALPTIRPTSADLPGEQMAAIGRGLISVPRLLLAGEPSMGLAPLVMQRTATALRTVPDRRLSTEQKAHPALNVADDAPRA